MLRHGRCDSARTSISAMAICESLEERRLLSAAPANGIAVIGDSDSDEYVFHGSPRALARNYVELMAQQRGVNFGAYSGHRDTPPRQGYAYNFAKGGDTSAGVLKDGQVDGVASLVAARKVSTVIVFIGSNDFLHTVGLSNAAATMASLGKSVLANLTTIVTRLRKASPKVKIVLATVADASVVPSVRTQIESGRLSDEAVTQEHKAISALNVGLRQLARRTPNVAIADVAGILSKTVAQPTLKIGSATIDTRAAGNSPSHLFLSDGVHMGTVAQATLANHFIQVMNRSFGTSLKGFSITEIRKLAGV